MSTELRFNWTPARVEALRKYITVDGLSYADAAQKLGCSRNTALGKAHRLKIVSPNGKGMSETKKAEMAKRKKEREAGRAKTQAAALAKAKQEELAAKPVKRYKVRVRLPPEFHDDSYFEAYFETKDLSFRADILNVPSSGQCKWITGDVRAHRARWCRKPVDGDSQYCLEHRRIVYVPHSEYRRRRR